MFSGQRDGSFIFNFRALDRERRYTIVRADKLLLNIAVFRPPAAAAQGIEKNVSRDEIRTMFHDYAIKYVVAERDFWVDLKPMRDLQDVLDSDEFTEIARLPVTANFAHTDREVRIYELRSPVSASPRPLRIDLPIINRTFDGIPGTS